MNSGYSLMCSVGTYEDTSRHMALEIDMFCDEKIKNRCLIRIQNNLRPFVKQAKNRQADFGARDEVVSGYDGYSSQNMNFSI